MLLLLGLLMVGAAWLLPWHFLPWLTFQQEVLAALGAGLMAVGAMCLERGRAWSVPVITLMLMGVAAIPVLQWALGFVIYHVDAALGAAYTLAFGLCIATGRSLSLSDRRGDFVAGWFFALLVASVASVAIGLVQWLGLEGFGLVADLPPRSRVFGNLAQPNHLATLLGMGLAALLWLYETRRIGLTGLAVAMVFLAFGMVMTQSRTAWLFLAGLMIWHAAYRKRFGQPLPIAAYVAALFAFGVVTAVWSPLNDHLLLFPAPDLNAKLTPGLRLIHWGTIVDALARSPLFGFGWGQVTHAQTLTATDHPATGEWLLYSHNVILDLMAWNGVPIGALIVLALFGYVVRRAWCCRSIDGWAMLAAAAAILLHSLLEYPHAYAFFLLPLGLMIGAAAGLEPRAAETQSSIWLPRIPAWGLLGSLFAVLGWLSHDYIKVEEASRQVRLYLMGVVTPGGRPEPPPDVILLDQPREYHRFWVTTAREGLDASTLDWMRDVTYRRPVPPALMRYAIATGLNGRPEEAERALNILCRVWGLTHCIEGRANWAKAVDVQPKLQTIRFPEDPPEAGQAHRGR